MTEDEEEVNFFEQVEHFNVERKEIVAQITDEALAIQEKVNNGNQFYY